MNQFVLTHPLYETNRAAATALDSAVPDELKRMLESMQGNSYANGFFRVVAPDPFRHYFSFWNLDAAQCVPFIKCAFGHLIFYRREQYQVLNPVHNCIDLLGEKGELDFVMDIMLCDRVGLENSFFIDIYEQALERLGAPQSDEIYAFVPAIRLGGGRNSANVQKVKMGPQLMILAQS